MNIHKHPWVNTKALRRANNGHLPIHIPYALGGPKIGHRPGPDYGSKVKKRPASASASGAAARGGSLSRRPPSATSTPPSNARRGGTCTDQNQNQNQNRQSLELDANHNNSGGERDGEWNITSDKDKDKDGLNMDKEKKKEKERKREIDSKDESSRKSMREALNASFAAEKLLGDTERAEFNKNGVGGSSESSNSGAIEKLTFAERLQCMIMQVQTCET